MKQRSFFIRMASGVSLNVLLGCSSVGFAQSASIDAGLTVTVPGSQASPWVVGGTLTVGVISTGTLQISTGGSVSSAGAYLGSSSGSSGLVMVSGAGSEWVNSGVLYVGNNGNGELTINNGGSVSSTAGPAYVGGQTTSTGIATVSGTGSSWETAQLTVGLAGNGTLDISAGGSVSSTSGIIGSVAGSIGTVTISGAGSQWTSTGTMTVGNTGSGTMLVENSAILSVGRVTGQGSLSLDGSTLQALSSSASFIDFTGAGTFELLSGGGTIDSNGFDIGAASVISGVGSLRKTGAGTLTLTAANTYAGNTTVAAGTLAVTGAGRIAGFRVTVGTSGSGTLNISGGGAVSTDEDGFIGDAAGGIGYATVDGVASRWDVGANLIVGRYGTGTLVITGGGIVEGTGDGRIGQYSGSTGSVTVSGAGSQWIALIGLQVGESGTGTLLIENGGTVTYGVGAHIGNNSGSNGTVTVDGPGSQLVGSAGVAIGEGGTGTLNITNGGTVSNTGGYIGRNSSGSGHVTVTGTGSQWNSSTNVHVGQNGSGILDITAGGAVSGVAAFIATEAGSTGSATVSGAGSQWTSSGVLTVGGLGSGSLVVQSGGRVSVAQVTGQGSMSVDAGTLQALSSNTSFINFTGAGTFELLSGGGTIDSNGFNIGASSAISGAGSLNKVGVGMLTLTAANTYAGHTSVAEGSLTLTGAGSILTTGIVDIAGGANFNVHQTTYNSGNYDFANTLTGSGTLTVELLAGSNTFDFGAGVGTGFTGTVSLGTGSFSLSGDNTTALSNAMLMLWTGNTTTVGTGNQSIGGLGFNGGTAIFDVTVPSAAQASGTIVTTGTLDATGTGRIQITVPPSFSVAPPTVSTELSLLEQDSTNILVQLVDASGATVIGGGGNLALVDQGGNSLSSSQNIDLTNTSGGLVVAEGHYDYRLTTGPDGDGLYVNYGLTGVDLIGTGADALILSPRAGATGQAADLSARISGTGDLAIVAGAGDHVSLSNSANSYEGTTFVRSGTLLFGNNNVLGQTDNLVLDAGTVVNTNGYSQSIGALNTASGSGINISGTLTITDGQRNPGSTDGGSIESGTLFGNGLLMIDPSIVYINGVQAGYTGAVTLEGGSQLLLNAANAFNNASGIKLTSATDILTFGDLSSHDPTWTGIANGTMQTSLSGLGTVEVLDGSDIALAGNNSSFSGRFEVAASSVLRALSGRSLGTASIDNDGTVIATANSNWALAGEVTGTGTFVKDGAATLQANDFLSSFTGQTQVDAGTLEFGSGSAAGVIGGSVDIASGATLAGIGTVAGNIVSSGAVAPGIGDTFGTMTVAGNYAATNGVVHITAQLGGDASPTGKLVITGNVSGTSTVRVTNLGGEGAETANGIQIIQVNGASPGNAFALSGDYTTDSGQQAVIGGVYGYTLQHGGMQTPGDGHWYLTSELTYTDPDTGEIEEVGPRYQPGVPLYEQYPQVLASLNTVPTLQQRVGNRYWQTGGLMAGNGANAVGNYGMWGRIEGSRTESEAARSTTFAHRSTDLWKLQTGFDFVAHEGRDGLLVGGVNVSHGTASSEIGSPYGRGKIDATGTGIGATLTWYGASGLYVDGQMQAMFFDSDITSTTIGRREVKGNNGHGLALSAETGYRYQLGNGFSLTPQAQLVWSQVHFDSFTDPFGARVSLQDGDSLRGRLGLSLDYEKGWTAADGTASRAHVYASANLYNEFLNGSKVRVEHVSFRSRDERLWAGIGLGGTYEWNNGRYAVYGNVNLAGSTNRMSDNHSFGGTLGFRATW